MLRFVDGFDNYTALAEKWSSVGWGGIGAGGRFGGNRLSQNYNGVGGSLIKVLDSQPTWIVGFAFVVRTYQARDFVQVIDNATVHMKCSMDASGYLNLNRNGTVLATGSVQPAVDVWHFCELKVTIHDTLGVAELRLNSIPLFSLTNQDTRNGANASADRIAIMHAAGGGPDPVSQYDDIYICDGQGSVNNDFLSDCRVISLLPNGDGATSQMVGSDGNSVQNYLLVDEATQNGDTDYVESSNVGDKDTYAFANSGLASGPVKGVQVCTHGKRTDAGPRSICHVARLSGVEQDGADRVLGSTYVQQLTCFDTKPGGGAWTLADVDNAEFGQKVTL